VEGRARAMESSVWIFYGRARKRVGDGEELLSVIIISICCSSSPSSLSKVDSSRELLSFP
jgi:hypothetical protein